LSNERHQGGLCLFAGIAEENGCGRLGTHYETIAERALHALFVLRTSRAANVVFHPSNDPLFRNKTKVIFGSKYFSVFVVMPMTQKLSGLCFLDFQSFLQHSRSFTYFLHLRF